jgi:hypothetical protein
LVIGGNQGVVKMGKIADRFANKRNKFQGPTTKILAVRHTADGHQEFAAFEAGSVFPHKYSQAVLLAHICLKDWVHTPPMDAIYAYLKNTKTYTAAKSMGMSCDAWIVNFYESDRDRPNTYSCREIVRITADDFHTITNNYKNGLDKDVMSIREYQ